MTSDTHETPLSRAELENISATAARVTASAFPNLRTFDVSLRIRGTTCILRASYSFGGPTTGLFSEDLGQHISQRALLSAFLRLETRLRESADAMAT